MKTQSYYRELLPIMHNGNFEVIDEPLIVNCTGFWKKETNENLIAHCPQGRKDYYLLYMVEGSIAARISGEEVTISRGDFVVYKPHTEYYHDFSHSDPLGYLWVHFTGFHAQRLLSDLGIDVNRIHKAGDDNDLIIRLSSQFERLFDEIANRRPGFDCISAAILTEVLVHLSRAAKQKAGTKKNSLNSIAYLHRHFRENTSVEALAAMENLSISRYRNVFKEQTGFSPTDYRTMLRILHARELLTQTDCTIKEAALKSGYADVYYFLRIFKTKEGITPGEYRAKSRQYP